MGSICSPDKVQNQEQNTLPPRTKTNNENDEPEPSYTAVSMSDVRDVEQDLPESIAASVSTDNLIRPKTKSKNKKGGGGGFRIEITPPKDNEDSDQEAEIKDDQNNKNNNNESNNNDNADTYAHEGQTDNKVKNGKNHNFNKIDPTLDGQISWKKVADFSALLPKDVKLKLWNGVFKSEADLRQPELKQISKVLRTFVMLQLTREYKRKNGVVPHDLKQKLPGAVKEPAKFVSTFLKRDWNKISNEFSIIHSTLSQKFETNDASKKAKYEKKKEIVSSNYNQLIEDQLDQRFCKTDFLKTSYLQYLLYGFQFKLDSENKY